MLKVFIMGFLSLYGFYCISAEVNTQASKVQEIPLPECLDFANDREFARMLHMSAGQKAYEKGDIEDALKCFKFVATYNGGTAQGMYLYGSLLLLKFKDSPKDENFALGLSYLETAMKAGYGAAAHDLGLRYLKGDGVSQDLKKAKECFLRNSPTNPKSRYYAGLLMYENSSNSIELVEGLKLMISSADAGYDFALKIVKEDNLRKELKELLLTYRDDVGLRIYNGQCKLTLDYEMAKKSFH